MFRLVHLGHIGEGLHQCLHAELVADVLGLIQQVYYFRNVLLYPILKVISEELIFCLDVGCAVADLDASDALVLTFSQGLLHHWLGVVDRVGVHAEAFGHRVGLHEL